MHVCFAHIYSQLPALSPLPFLINPLFQTNSCPCNFMSFFFDLMSYLRVAFRSIGKGLLQKHGQFSLSSTNNCLYPQRRVSPQDLPPSLLQDYRMLMGLIIWSWSCACVDSCYEFTSMTAVLWQEDNVTCHSTPFSMPHIHPLLLKCSLSFGRGDIDVSFVNDQPVVTYSSTLTSYESL